MFDVDRTIALLAAAGLDIVHAFDAHAIGELARADAALEAKEAREQVPTMATNRDGSERMVLSKSRPLAKWVRLANGPRAGLLVGNTRAIWPRFVDARAELPRIDPLDAYVKEVIENAIARSSTTSEENDTGPNRTAAATERTAAVTAIFSHQRYDAVYLPFQHLAVATGLAALSDAGLAIHPTFGPWFALRAVILFDPPAGFAMSSPASIAKPCACDGTCEKALAIARADIRDWRAWLAVRDACSLRDYRYSDEQIRFHYASAWPKAAQT